ncbi:MAG: stalk domain-containing protein, partial [Peptostreptococcaceae bacterium]|nr:stalk domain-containing protein [Peptostreptococcaceae bacterium]
ALSNEYTISPNRPTGLQKGDSEIVITHTATKTTYQIPITVGDAKPRELLLSPPTKKIYDKGDIFIPDGMMATLKKTDGSSIQLIPFSEFGAHHLQLVTPVAGTKLMQEGEQRVRVRYQKSGESFEGETTINVGAAQLREIELTPPTKQNYVEGQTISQEGMEIKLKWSDREEIVPLNELANYGLEMTPNFGIPLTLSNDKIEIRHASSKKVKNHNITVVPISVTALTTNEIKKDYVENNLLDLNNLVVTLHKNNGTQEQVNYAEFDNHNLSVNPENGAQLTTDNSEIVITHANSNQSVSIPIRVEEAKVNNLSIEGDFKKNYAAGESIDFENAKLVIRKTDGSEEKVSLNALSNEYTISPNRPTGLQKGDSEIVITHTATKTTYQIPITVGDAKVNNLSIEGTVRTQYAAGERIDFENAKLVIRKTDGSEEKVSLNALSNEYTISPNRPTGLQKSDREIVITHVGTQTTHQILITVGDAKVNGIEIELPPRDFVIGDELNLRGLIVHIHKTDGSQKSIVYENRESFAQENLVVSPTEQILNRASELTVAYVGNDKASAKVEKSKEIIVHEVQAIGITQPNKRIYQSGESFAIDGLSVTLDLGNRKVRTIESEKFAENGISLSVQPGEKLKAGRKQIMVTYSKGETQKQTSFDIEVAPAIVQDMRLTPPTKKQYNAGESLSLDGLAVVLVMSDGEEVRIAHEDFGTYSITMDAQAGEKLVAGQKNITVTYSKDGIQKQQSFDIEVAPARLNQIEIMGLKEKYFAGDLFPVNDIRAKLHWSNGTSSDEIPFAQFEQNGLTMKMGNIALSGEKNHILGKGNVLTVLHVSGVSSDAPIKVEDRVTLKLKGGFPEEFNPNGFLVLDVLRIVRTVNNANEEIIDFNDFAAKRIEISHPNSMPLERDFNFIITDIDSGVTLTLPVNLYWGIRYRSGDGIGDEVNLDQKYNGEESLEITLPNSDFENGSPIINPFVAPAGKEFAGWKIEDKQTSQSVDNEIYKEGEKYVVKDKVIFVAQWKEIATAPETDPSKNANNAQALPPTQNNPNGNSSGGKDEDDKGSGDGDGDGGGGKKTDENTSPNPNTNIGGESGGNKDGQNPSQPDNSVQTEDDSSNVSPGGTTSQSDNSSTPSDSGTGGQPADNSSMPNASENGSQAAGGSGEVTGPPDSSSGSSSTPSTSITQPTENPGDKNDASTGTQTGEENSGSSNVSSSGTTSPSDNSSAEDEAQRQRLEQMEREKEAERQREIERQRQLEEQARIERERELENQFENQNYSYLGEQPKNEATPKSNAENLNPTNIIGEGAASSEEPLTLGKLLAELRIGEREYRQLENDVLVTKVMDVPPMIHENRTMLPARVVAELLNVEVDFDNASKTAYFQYQGNLIELALGQQRMKINGEEKMLTADVLNVQGRVLMPITDVQRALVDLGLHVDFNWEHFAKEVQLIDKDKQKQK